MLINQEVIHALTKHIQNTSSTGTVKQGYSEHAYNELTLTEKWFSFKRGGSMTLLLVVNTTDITNYAYNEFEAKLSIPGTLL